MPALRTAALECNPSLLRPAWQCRACHARKWTAQLLGDASPKGRWTCPAAGDGSHRSGLRELVAKFEVVLCLLQEIQRRETNRSGCVCVCVRVCMSGYDCGLCACTCVCRRRCNGYTFFCGISLLAAFSHMSTHPCIHIDFQDRQTDGRTDRQTDMCIYAYCVQYA